jgi:glycosyltransferase XagB
VNVMIVVFVFIALTLFAISAGTLWWMLHAWRTPQNYMSTRCSTYGVEGRYTFSVIIPCRDEPYEVMEATIQRLLAQTHMRHVEVVISVGDDDPDTADRAKMLARLNPGVVKVSLNRDYEKNKPRQLNSALLELCTGDIVGVMDAESLAAFGLLEHIDATFQVTGADVVQGAVHLVNYRSRWFTLRNCLEYRIWFRSRLHGHAESGFIPLGGNTVFIWRDLLEQVGGWDGDCLAEDCEIGVRLSSMGKKVVCVYDPELTTLEEAPTTIHGFVKQRTRWSLGFMQVLAKGDWKNLPTFRKRVGGLWTLAQQYAVAFAGVIIPIAFITALFVKVPTLVAMLTYLPLIPLLMTVGFELLVLHEFGRDMGWKLKVRDYVMLVVTTPFYQALLLWSSLRAVWKYVHRDFGWEKTHHSGEHLDLVKQPARHRAPILSTQREGRA